jgi:hypothetical protein
VAAGTKAASTKAARRKQQDESSKQDESSTEAPRRGRATTAATRWFIAMQLPEGGGGERMGTMGVIVREEYVCDYCGTGINGERALVGRLSLRKAGARGLARNMQVLLHAECSDKLIRYAKPIAPETKRVRNGAE